MRRILIPAALALGVLVAVPAVHLTAYVTNGHSWGTKTITYYVNPDNLYVPAASAISGVQGAASVWNTQAGVDVQLVYGGTTTRNSLTLDYTNNVFFRNDSSGYIAETYWWWDGTGKLVDADIVFHENYRFYTGNTGCNGDGYYVESTGAHEFGHALGLGHSGTSTATMWPSTGACDTSFETLDQDDLAGIQSLYPAAVINTSAPGAPSSPSPANGATGVSTTPTLKWSSSNAQSYDLYLNGQLLAPGLTSASYSLSGLALGTSYTWSIVARNSIGSTTGSSWAFTTQTSTTTQTNRGKKR